MKFRSSLRVAGILRARTIASLSCMAILGGLVFGVQETTLAASSPSPGSDQLFGIHPVEQGQTTLPGGHFNFALVPGERITDGIVVENFSNHSLQFQVYGADLVTATGGGLAPAQATTTMRQVGAWIEVVATTLIVAAHGHVTDQFTLTLPADVSSGQHLGALVAAADVGVTQQGNPIEARIALITVVTVAGTAHPSARLTPLHSSGAQPGRIGFAISLSNTGNVLLTYAGSVEIDDAAGLRVATLALTPTDSYVVPDGQVPLAAVWTGITHLSMQGTARATVTILSDGKPVGTLRSQSLTVALAPGVPIPLVVGSVLLLLAILLLVTWSASRARRVRMRRVDRNVPGITVHGLR